MKHLITASILLFSALGQASTLHNISLRTHAPENTFATCAMNAANAQLVHSQGKLSLLQSDIESDDSPPSMGVIHFLVLEPNLYKNQIFILALTSVDKQKGWQAQRAPDGESYPSSAAVDSTAELETYYVDIGPIDLSGCQP